VKFYELLQQEWQGRKILTISSIKEDPCDLILRRSRSIFDCMSTCCIRTQLESRQDHLIRGTKTANAATSPPTQAATRMYHFHIVHRALIIEKRLIYFMHFSRQDAND
jgi:hypothetical protein